MGEFYEFNVFNRFNLTEIAARLCTLPQCLKRTSAAMTKLDLTQHFLHRHD
ncbi:hypothetical protein VOA_001267 [Vibrio sp. RC586]|nr:hypothetical protein VOA_001267 [Vibrio sp. RC586]